MKKKHLYLLIVITFTFCTAVTIDEKCVFSQCAPSVVVVQTKTVKIIPIILYSGEIGLTPVSRSFEATGFSVLDGYKLLTCWHVVDEDSTIEIVSGKEKIQAVRIIKKDPLLDLALVEINTHLPPLRFARSIKTKDVVHQIGHPDCRRWIETIGIFAGIECPYNIFDVETHHGNSGSPILNTKGEVVGMTQAVSGTTRTYACTLNNLLNFIKCDTD